MGVTFECNMFSFRNVVGRDLVEMDTQDELTAIRRILLNVIWALHGGILIWLSTT